MHRSGSDGPGKGPGGAELKPLDDVVNPEGPTGHVVTFGSNGVAKMTTDAGGRNVISADPDSANGGEPGDDRVLIAARRRS